MIHGIDTSYLVAVAVETHAAHQGAFHQIRELVVQGHPLAIAPQVLAEFIHVVTDGKRFASPLSMKEATATALAFWQMKEVQRVHPNDEAAELFLHWIEHHRLGRKRLLDTMLAATYKVNGVHSVLTLNPGDFQLFDAMQAITPPVVTD